MTKLIDRTPNGACSYTASCPAVFEAGDDFVIIGKVTGKLEFAELAGRIGSGERAVKISAKMLRQALGIGAD